MLQIHLIVFAELFKILMQITKFYFVYFVSFACANICIVVACKTTGLKVKSTFRRTGPLNGPQCDEVFFYHDNSSEDKQWLSDMM